MPMDGIETMKNYGKKTMFFQDSPDMPDNA
jgi:hypothetical protein